MFLHLVVPHHHHVDSEEAIAMERHAGDADHPDHHHHTIDLFFSLLQFVDDIHSFELATPDNQEPLLLADLTVLIPAVEPCGWVLGGNESPPWIDCLTSWISECEGLRGPPVV